MNERKHRGVYQHPRQPGVWCIHYYDAEGRRHRERIGKWRNAVDAYVARKASILGGTFQPPGRKKRLPFATLLDEALAYKKARTARSSQDSDRKRGKRLREMFGEIESSRITPALIETKFAVLLDGGISGSTANRYRSLLSSVFSYAVRSGKLVTNPVARFFRYKENPGRVRFLSSDEEAALRNAIRTKYADLEPLFDLALHTGIRRGEQFGLKWEDVDLDNSIITVRGKTGRRYVPLSTKARAALAALYPLSNGSAYVSPHARHDGQSDWTRWFEKCVREASLDNFTWHDLRHTFASRRVMAGVSLSAVQRLLGHTTIVTTQKYAHLSPGHLQAAAEMDGSTAIKQPLSAALAAAGSGANR